MRGESPLVLDRRRAAEGALEDGVRLLPRQSRRVRLLDAVVGRRRAERSEDCAPLGERLDERFDAGDRRAAQPLERRERGPPVGSRGLEEAVGAEGRDDASLPPRVANGRMMRQRVRRGVGRRERLDVESLEQRARPELGAAQLLDDLYTRSALSASSRVSMPKTTASS